MWKDGHGQNVFENHRSDNELSLLYEYLGLFYKILNL